MDNKEATLELGTKPVGKLLLQYAMPAIIAMTAASLYNTVDSIFIGQGVGPTAISGLAITFPFMNLAAAFGAAVGVGSSTFLSMKLGQEDYAAARKILGNTVTLNLIIGIAFTLVSISFIDPILRFFGASDQTLPYARDYMLIILAGNVISHSYFGINALLRASGKPREAMYGTIFTVILNTILDPLFIWPLGMGIQGAAYATVLSQAIAWIWQMRHFVNQKAFLHFTKDSFKLRRDIVRNVISIGISPFSMNVCACIVVIIINNSLVKYGGDIAVGAYGIANKVGFVFVMISFGVVQGMQPIVGYNYGAQKLDRMLRTLNLTIIGTMLVMTIGFIIGQFLSYPSARLFTGDKELIEHAIHGMRITMLMYPIVGFQIVVTNFFQSIGKAKISMFMSLSRQLLFLIPMLLILPHYFNIDGVWASMPTSDFISTVVAFFIMMSYMRRFKKQHKALNHGKE